jgi:hypothetical protein
MNFSPQIMRYLVWAAVVLLGALSAAVDRRWIRRPVLGMLLAAGVGGGFIVTEVSPFTFGTSSYYMEGVVVAAGSALALSGYVFGAVLGAIWRFARRRISRLS